MKKRGVLGPLLGLFQRSLEHTSEQQKSNPVLLINSYISRLLLCHAVKLEFLPSQETSVEARDNTHKCAVFLVHVVGCAFCTQYTCQLLYIYLFQHKESNGIRQCLYWIFPLSFNCWNEVIPLSLESLPGKSTKQTNKQKTHIHRLETEYFCDLEQTIFGLDQVIKL